MSATAVYLEQKLAQRCTYKRCATPPEDGARMCKKHLEKVRRYERRYRKRRRAEARERGECAFCGAKAATYRCLACAVKHKQVPSSVSVQVGVNTAGRSSRIAAATRTHADGRTRYHGQGKRGMQPRLQLDGQDLGFVRREIDAGEAGLRVYESEAVQAMPRIQREDVKAAALHHLQRASGFIDDVLERRGHFKMRHGRREGE